MRIKTAFLAVALLSSSSLLFGAGPSKWQEMTRQNAAMHLQLEITQVIVPPKVPGICRVTGQVGQIFDDRLGLLEEGKTVQLGLACFREDDELPRSIRRWTLVDDLEAASFLEAYIDLRADSHYPRRPALNYSLRGDPTEKPALYPKRRNTHFVVTVDAASSEEGSQQVDVKGTIRKVYLDKSALLSVDKQLTFTLDCATRHTMPCRVITGAEGQYLEVMFYLNSPLDQAGIIDGLTEEPTCPRDVEGFWCEPEDEEETGTEP